MFSHVFVGVNDFERALAFYTPLMALLGAPLRFVDRQRPWAGWQSVPGPRPLFVVGSPFDGRPAQAGNGQMVAFMANDRVTVERAHALALSLGGQCDGAPGLRPEYHADYFGAYFRDPQGNKLCVACHGAAPAPAAGD